MEYSHQYKIGNFFWELPDLPTKCQTIFDTVNEIWAATSFLKSVFENAGDCPVYLVPTPGASLRPCDGDLREILGIDQEAFVFGYMFDAQSSLARKNPHAVLAAYNIMRGMLPAATKVALLFKVHRITSSSISDFLRLRDLTEDQDGVFFLTASLSHNRLKRCFNTMDAYVSLHRSEGLGRTIIEAAQSGMPVLCTNYSGSADIVETGAVIGIDWRLSPVMSDAYSQNEPSCWAEPNVEQAARIMARVVQNPNYYRPTAAALDKLATRFSAESFVDVASRRLREADINSYINVGQ